MYEDIIDWVSLSEVIGVMPAAFLKVIFVLGMPPLVLLGLSAIYCLVIRLNTAIRKYLVSDITSVLFRLLRALFSRRNVIG